MDRLRLPLGWDVSPEMPPMNVRAEDPVLTSARREALLAFGIWLTACVYSVGFCYRFGYGRDVDSLTYVLGFPDWMFWGVVVPWTVCTILCLLLSHFVIRDADLGEEQTEERIGGERTGGNGVQQEAEHA